MRDDFQMGCADCDVRWVGSHRPCFGCGQAGVAMRRPAVKNPHTVTFDKKVRQ